MHKIGCTVEKFDSNLWHYKLLGAALPNKTDFDDHISLRNRPIGYTVQNQ
jgi:hypothetical protein